MAETARVLGYQSAVDTVREAAVERVSAIWAGLPSYRGADIDQFIDIVAPLVQAGQLQVAQLTDAFFEGPGADEAMVLGGRGVPVDTVNRRPAVTTYTALSKGAAYSVAVDAGLNRLRSISATDMQMAKVRQAQAAMQYRGVKQYRRVLTGNENCALCVIASTQRYWVKDLQPIHPGCDCGQEELHGNAPLNQVIDRDLLELTHAEIEKHLGRSDRSARNLDRGKTVEYSDGEHLADYTDLIAVREHGEIGPVLTWRDQRFTSAKDIPGLT